MPHTPIKHFEESPSHMEGVNKDSDEWEHSCVDISALVKKCAAPKGEDFF